MVSGKILAGRYEIDGKKVYASPSTKIQNHTSHQR